MVSGLINQTAFTIANAYYQIIEYDIPFLRTAENCNGFLNSPEGRLL
jgi:hypothetical protein